jgi:hypothetical protein
MSSDDFRSPSPRRVSLLAALLDVQFERRLTLVLVRWVYVGSLVVVGFGALFGLLWVWSLSTWLGGAMWLAAPVLVEAGLVMIFIVRIFCECVLSWLPADLASHEP